MTPFLPCRRPTTLGENRRQQATPPRQAVMSFEVYPQFLPMRLENHAASGSALLGVKVVGRLESESAIGPVAAGENGPIRSLPDSERAVNEALPPTCRGNI